MRTRSKRNYVTPLTSWFTDWFFEANVGYWQLPDPIALLVYSHDSTLSPFPDPTVSAFRQMRDEIGTWPDFGECRNWVVDKHDLYRTLISDDMLGVAYLNADAFSSSTTACNPSRYGLYSEALLQLPPIQVPAIAEKLYKEFDWVRRANTDWRGFYGPSLTDDISLVNFLVELKDLITLAKFLKTQRGFLTRLGNAFTEGQTLQFVIESVSKGFLTWAFGILPLVRDLGTIADRLVTWQKRAAEFESLANKYLYHHRPQQEVQWKGTLPPEARFTAHREGVPIDVIRKVEWRSLLYSSTMAYSYSIPDCKGIVKQCRQFASVIGLNLDAAIVWNAIPYSFVVDWIYDVGGYLSTFRVDAYAADMYVRDFCHSLRSELEVSYHALGSVLEGADGQVNPAYSAHIGSEVYSIYQRSRFRPGTMDAMINVKKPGAMQIALGAALIGAQRNYQPRFFGS